MDVLNLSEPLQINIKKEQEEKQEEVKFYLPPTPGAEFIGDITQKVGAAAVVPQGHKPGAPCSDIHLKNPGSVPLGKKLITCEKGAC